MHEKNSHRRSASTISSKCSFNKFHPIEIFLPSFRLLCLSIACEITHRFDLVQEVAHCLCERESDFLSLFLDRF